MYALIFPLGQIDNFFFRLKDHFSIWEFTTMRRPRPVKHQASAIDWKAAITAAEAEEKLKTNNNNYGIDNLVWSHKGYLGFEFHAPGSANQIYLTKLKRSQEWGDLEILLEVLRELGAKPLILSRPINGTLYAAAGISSNAQQAYYSRLKELVNSYNFPLVDFQEYTSDRYFSVDYASHSSPKGWVLVDQVLDAFFHDRIWK